MLFSQISVVRVGVGGLGYSGDQTNGPGVCLAGLDGKPWNRFSFVVLAYSGHISCYFSAFLLFAFSLGFLGYTKDRLWGGNIIRGIIIVLEIRQPPFFRLLISHTYLAGPAMFVFMPYCLLFWFLVGGVWIL